jgi:hypothetical protein
MINKKKIILWFAFLITFTFVNSGCDVAKQAQQVSNLSSCDFRIWSVENVNLAGVEFQHVKSISDLGLADAARIMGGLASPTFPLSLQLNLEGRNPNAKEAGLNRLEWILFIDDIQMTTGILDKPFIIPAKGSTNIPVQIALDLKTVLSGKSAEALIKFCLNLAGMGNEPTRFKIKLKPTVLIGTTLLRYPGFITVNTTFTGK